MKAAVMRNQRAQAAGGDQLGERAARGRLLVGLEVQGWSNRRSLHYASTARRPCLAATWGPRIFRIVLAATRPVRQGTAHLEITKAPASRQAGRGR